MFRVEFYMPDYSIEHCYGIYESMPMEELICEYELALKVLALYDDSEVGHVSGSIVWEYANAVAQIMRNVICERMIRYRYLLHD